MIEIIKPTIFPSNILAGVVTANREDYPIHGFSIKESEYHSAPDVDMMRRALSMQLGFHPLDMAYQDQVHGDNIKMVDNEYEIGESDAMISFLRRKILNVAIADCPGILIYCPDKKMIAAVHSGWRGTKQNIVSKTIKKLVKEFDVDPSQTLVYISPSASVDSYEVGKEFLELFPKNTIKRDGNYFFDNKKEIQDQLVSNGIKLKNIEIDKRCTIKDPNLHSFRRDKEAAGRMSAFIVMT